MATTSSDQPTPSSPQQLPLYSFGRPWPDLNEGLSYTDVVRRANSDLTLIEFYSSSYKNSAPLEGWIHRIRNGLITVGGEVVRDPNTILSDVEDIMRAHTCHCDFPEGSTVVYHRLPWKEQFAPHVLEVLYEDDDMVAINKPSGLQVLPGGLFQQRTVLTQLQWKEWRKPSEVCLERKTAQAHPVPVHRLGRGTSGILLCAKTKLAKVSLASYLSEGTANAGVDSITCGDEPEFGKARKISKFYRALVTGVLENDEVTIKQPIGLIHYPGVAQGLYVASSLGKPAMSKVHALERNLQKNRTLVQVEIHSGRPHQIRIHLAFIGHPLLDDPLYDVGGQPKFYGPELTNDCFAEDGGYQKPVQPVPGDCGYHLHAHQLVLCHPTTNETVKITAPLPPILQTQEELHQSGLANGENQICK